MAAAMLPVVMVAMMIRCAAAVSAARMRTAVTIAVGRMAIRGCIHGMRCTCITSGIGWGFCRRSHVDGTGIACASIVPPMASNSRETVTRDCRMLQQDRRRGWCQCEVPRALGCAGGNRHVVPVHMNTIGCSASFARAVRCSISSLQ